jgi:hypothetical protein
MTADDLRREIEQTRQHLGETVDELAARADVTARAKARVAGVTAQARGRVAAVSGQVSHNAAMRRRWPAAMAGAGVLIAASALVRRWKQA